MRRCPIFFWAVHVLAFQNLVFFVCPVFFVQWALAKKMFVYKFNSYVVSTERETKNLQPELSHRIHSRAHQHVKSPIKAPRQWPPSQLLLRVHFLKCHLPKTCDRLRTRYATDCITNPNMEWFKLEIENFKFGE